MRGLLLFASLVHVAHASVLHDLASALLPERHVVYQHLVSTTGRAYTDVAELKPSAHSAGWASHLVDPTWTRTGFQIGQKSFGTGIYVHSPSSVEYHTGSRYSVFTGCAGVDDRKHAAEQCGDNVEFHVVTDNGTGKKTAWSAMRKAGDAASCFSVPMLNVRKLELVVKTAQGAACDRAEWVNMKLYEDPAIDCRRIASLAPDPRSVGWVDPLLKKGQQSAIKFARSWPRDGFRVGGQRFSNGVFATTNSKIFIPLHGKYDSFTACAGVDDMNGDCGSGATFRAALDGTQHWSKKLSNGVKAECFSFTTKGAIELELSVSSNKEGCKKADWVNGQLCSVVKRAPIDCQVTPYSAFTACSKSCGTGYRTRTRKVLKPAANGGQACPALFETVQCNTVDCPVDCTVGQWGAWSPCSVSCGGGTRSRSRQETRAAVFGGAACKPLRHETGCAPQHCPVDCKMAQWSAWGSCSQPCGGGTRTRTRDLTQPRYGGRACVKGTESEECNIQLCKKDCKVSNWGDWSKCSKSCGTGFQHRSRTQSQKAQMGGKHCPGLHDTRACNVAACPIDCVLGPWTAYDECSHKCGGGTQKRRRSIHVDAAYGGARCGALTSTKRCNEHCCAGRELVHGKCRDCNVGSFQPSHEQPKLGGAPKCTMCPAGQHQNMPGKAFCLPCPAGRHAFAKGFGVCEACPAGKTALEGKTECFDCPAGKYSDKGWSFCAECPHGKVAITNVRDYTNNFIAPAAKACTDCPTGQFARSKGTVCAHCEQGKFHPKGYSPQLYKVWTDPTDPMGWPDCARFAPCDPGMELTGRGPENSGTCTPCKHGFYKSIEGSWGTKCSRCLGCPAGQMRVGCSASSAGRCVACSAGTFKETGVEVGAFDTKCAAFSACPAGQFLAGASATSQGQCRSCPASTFKVGKGTWQTKCTSCQKCDKGQFLDKCGGSNGGYCMGCPAGKFQEHKAQETCKSCATGHYSTQSDADRLAYRGPTECSACSKGKFAAVPGSESCATCPHGRYNDQTGRSNCFGECATGCVSGSYRKGCTAHTAGKCTKCPKGTYTVPYHFGCIDKNACMTGDFATPTGCRQCPGGKFKDTIGQTGCTSCKSCPEGQERVGCGDNNPGTCAACAVGTFKSGTSDASCAACPAGRFAAKSGSFECHACNKGQYQDDTGKTECEMCLPGQSASAIGQVTCQECAKGKYSGTYGSSACTNCAAGRFAANAGAQHVALCEKCHPGHFQPSAGQASCHACHAGTHTPTYGATSGAACIRCAGGRYSGVGAGTCTQCAAGRKGTLHNQCGDCPTGRFQQFSGSTSCERCSSGRYAPRDGHSSCVDCAVLVNAPGGNPRVGDRVRARYQGSTRHFVGNVVEANGKANTFDVKFDDGKRDRTVPANDIATHFYWTEGEAGASKCTMHPVDCQVSAWVDEGACSKSCGGGKQRQRRRVTRPEWGNGIPCSTYPLTAFKPCNTQACPVDCVPGAWGSWSKCTNPCGGGTQQRERPVAHAAQHGGKACSAMTENLRCNEHKCQPRDCSHVKCLMKQVSVNGMVVSMPIVFHHKLEHNGWHHTCGYDPTHADDCRCICKHTVEEFDPMHVKRLGGSKVKKMLMANAAA